MHVPLLSRQQRDMHQAREMLAAKLSEVNSPRRLGRIFSNSLSSMCVCWADGR